MWSAAGGTTLTSMGSRARPAPRMRRARSSSP